MGRHLLLPTVPAAQVEFIEIDANRGPLQRRARAPSVAEIFSFTARQLLLIDEEEGVEVEFRKWKIYFILC